MRYVIRGAIKRESSSSSGGSVARVKFRTRVQLSLCGYGRMGERKGEEGVEGTDSKEIREYRWKHEVEETRRKKDDEFRNEISLRNEYNTKYNMCKPSFQGLSGEASQKVFPFDTALAIVLAVEVDLPRMDQVELLLFLPCIFGIILVFPGRHYECTHHKHNSCTR